MCESSKALRLFSRMCALNNMFPLCAKWLPYGTCILMPNGLQLLFPACFELEDELTVGPL